MYEHVLTYNLFICNSRISFLERTTQDDEGHGEERMEEDSDTKREIEEKYKKLKDDYDSVS